MIQQSHFWASKGDVPAGALGNSGDASYAGLIPASGRSPGGGHDNPLSILAWRIQERGAWRATVHGVAKSQTRLGDWAHTGKINDLFTKYSVPHWKMIFFKKGRTSLSLLGFAFLQLLLLPLQTLYVNKARIMYNSNLGLQLPNCISL